VARGQPAGLCVGGVVCVEVRLSGRRMKTDTVPRATAARLTYETAAQQSRAVPYRPKSQSKFGHHVMLPPSTVTISPII
jgi:hypothetical protein